MELISAHLRIPQRDLEVQHLLGAGTFGSVYKGIWRGRGGGTIVAIKQIHANEKLSIRDICKELNIMATLRFQHICQVHGGCTVGEDEVWIVLDYVEGGNLHKFLQGFSPLPWKIQISFALQAAKAVNYLHTGPTALLHRDIKSHNFLVKDGNKIVLTDFGLSKAMENITTNTMTIGTLCWAAPEVLGENPDWTEKADIYSLGMLFYELVAREPPFKGEANFFSIHKKIRNGIRPKLPFECPQKFSRIIRKCWNQDPKVRPTSLELIEMLDDLNSETPLSTIDEEEVAVFHNRASVYLVPSSTPMQRSPSLPALRPRTPVLIPPTGGIPQNEEATGNTPLHKAARQGLAEEVRALVMECGSSLDVVNIFGYTPLHLAAEFGHAETVKELLKLGAKGNVGKVSMYTPLHVAAEHGHTEVVEILVKLGHGDVNSVRVRGYTPLHLAAKSGKTETVRTLVKLGAIVDIKNSSGRTPVQLAYTGGHTDTAMELVQSGGKMDGVGHGHKRRAQSCSIQ